MWLKENQDWEKCSSTDYKIRGINYIYDRMKVPASKSIFTIFKCWYGSDPYHYSVDQAVLIINLIISKTESISFCFKVKQNTADNYSLNLINTSSDKDLIDRIKLIPRIIESSWFIKNAVREVPVLIGRHLESNVIPSNTTSNGFKSKIIDINISSGKIANSIASICSSYKKSIVIQLAFLFEGREEETLPEEILGVIQLNKLKCNLNS